ncbi:MAG: acyl carrier protein [Acetobacteraceae bacterium]|nr:acyl carrier protein [Acetobacteraceae bacterium]
MKAKIRALLERLGEFPAGPEALRDDADLHAAGLSSYGTVELMVGIEEEFGVEFPDALLTRATFGSIDSVAAAVAVLLDRGNAPAPAARADAA